MSDWKNVQYKDGKLRTNNGGSGGASALSDLTDVDLTDIADGQILKWDATNSKWINANESGGYSQPDEILCESIVLPFTNLSTNSTSAYNFWYFEPSHINAGITVPTGYELKYAISAFLNSADSNYCELYINNTLLRRASTWIGAPSSAYNGHYGMFQISNYYGLNELPKANRYLGGSQQGYNINFRSSSSVYAMLSSPTIHRKLVKIAS